MISETDVLNLSGLWNEYNVQSDQFQPTATLTMRQLPSMSLLAKYHWSDFNQIPLAPSSRTISVTSGVTPWYDTNLNGLYNYFETYNSFPVYKVSLWIIFCHIIDFGFPKFKNVILSALPKLIRVKTSISSIGTMQLMGKDSGKSWRVRTMPSKMMCVTFTSNHQLVRTFLSEALWEKV